MLSRRAGLSAIAGLSCLFRIMNDMMDDDDFMTEKCKPRLVPENGRGTVYIFCLHRDASVDFVQRKIVAACSAL